MKIPKPEKFQPKKQSKKKGLNSETAQTKEEYTRIDEELENHPEDGYAEHNVSPSSEPQAKDEYEAKVDGEPKDLSDNFSKAAARDQYDWEPKIFVGPQSGKFSEKSLQNDAKPKDFTDHSMQTFFESLPHENPEPLAKDMNLSENPSDNKPKVNSEDLSPDKQRKNFYPDPEREQIPEQNLKSASTGESYFKDTASIRRLRRLNMKNPAKPEEEDEEIPKRKKKDPGGTGGETTEPPKFSLRDVFYIIFKRKLQIVICFSFIVFITVVVTLMMKPVYEASAEILVKLGRESVFVPTSGNVTPILNINREEQVNSEIEILKSRSLAEKVIATLGPTTIYPKLAEEKSGFLDYIFPENSKEMTPDERKAANFESAVIAFMRSLTVTGVRKSNVIEVSFKNENPHMSAEVVNNLSNLYLEHHLAIHKTPQNVKFFQEQTIILKNKLDQAEEKLEALRKQHKITSLEEQRTLLLGRSSELNAALNQTISEEVETEKRIHLLDKQLASVPKTISQGEETDQNPYLINTLEARLVELQLKEKELLTKYADNSRLVQNVKEEIRVVEQKLKEQETKSYGKKTSGINPTYQRLKEELFRNEADLEALKAKKITQRDHLVRLQVKLENLNQVELKLNQLQQEIEVDRENYRLYLSKLEESRISDAMDSEKIASVSLIGPARPSRKPVSPKILLNVLIGIFLGVFGSLTLALFRDYLDDRIEKIEDVEKELQLPVLASVPIFEKKAAGADRF